MIPLDYIKKINNARLELLECTAPEEVEKVFQDYEITGCPPKIALLRRCMQMQKAKVTPGIGANEEAAYEECLAFFLTGKWKKDNLTEEPAILDSASGLPDVNAKKQPKKGKGSFDTDELCKSFDVSERECNLLKDFYEMKIVPRIQKKYLAQLISVVEDMIEDVLERNREQENHKAGKYRINLVEFKQDFVLEWRTGIGRSICFPNFSLILYDPNLDANEIRVSIAHELGHLLQHFFVINGDNVEKMANLFAYFVIKEENSLYAAEHPSNAPNSDAEIIQGIKKIFPNR
jgi:hypothetical protein